jgi:hypothetical protein
MRVVSKGPASNCQGDVLAIHAYESYTEWFLGGQILLLVRFADLLLSHVLRASKFQHGSWNRAVSPVLCSCHVAEPHRLHSFANESS